METVYLENTELLPIDNTPSAHLVSYNDPFNPNDKTFLLAPIGASCYEVLKDFSFDTEFYDLIISRNQEIVNEDFIIEDKDVINFLIVPKGGGGSSKQILTVVAMIALAVAAPYAAGAAVSALGLGTATTLAGAFSLSLTAGLVFGGVMVGTMMLGSMLISSLFKPNMPSTPSLQSFDNSTTYGWNVQGNSIAQGGAVPILYGTHRVTPQYIGKYLDTIGDKQYLKCLLAIGEGPLDSINEIRINDNDLTTFTNVVCTTRNGTNTQTTIPDFSDTWSDKAVNKKLTDVGTWVSAQTDGNQVTSMNIGVVCPNGVFFANDAGGLDNYSLHIAVQYKAVSSPTWLNLPDSGHVIDTMYYYVDQTPAIPFGTPYADNTGPFDIYKKQITAKGDPTVPTYYVGSTPTRPNTATGTAAYPPGAYGTQIQQYAWCETKADPSGNYFTITDNRAVSIRKSYRVEGLAPDQYEVRMCFYSAPNTSSRYGTTCYFESLQEAIPDDFTYPNTALLGMNILATDQLSGGLPKITCLASRITGTYGNLNNPAWACLDLLMNSRYGAGLPLSRIDFQAFSDWATFCDSANLKVNIYIDQTLTLMQCLNLIGQLGRGSVRQYGSTFTVLVDKPDIMATQGFLFSMGNIIQGSFSESFLPLKDRANIIEVTYYDAETEYARTSIEVAQGNYDLITQVNKTSIDLLGCTSRAQALRQAKYHLNQNRFLTITATWEASIDSIHCKVGDVVNVAHDVPQWGYSGRIISTNTNTVTVDRNDLTLTTGINHYIQISDSNTDTQIYLKVLNIIGDLLVLESNVGVVGEYSVYSFGQVNRHAKKMRILSISTAGDLKRKITALEYNENVYNDTVVVPTPILVGDLSTKDLVASEYLKVNADSTIAPVVQLAWKGAAFSYDVYYKRLTDSVYTLAGVARGNYFDIYGLTELETYEFKVDTAIIHYKVLGKTTPPDAITNLTGSEHSNTFTLNWSYAYRPVDFSHFDVYANGILTYSTVNTNASIFIATNKAIAFGVVAVDTTGNQSTMMSITVDVQGLGPVTGIKSYYINEYTKLTWNIVDDIRQPIDYEVRMGTVWDNGFILGRTAIPEYTLAANGWYMIKAHYKYPNGSDLYSTTPALIEVTGAVLPKNIVAGFDEKATGWLGSKTNLYINADGNLELMSSPLDIIPIVDTELVFDYAGGIQPTGIYEIPASHIVDIGTAQVCRLWIDYAVEGRVVTDRVDSTLNFDNWVNVDGYSSKFNLRPQVAIAQNDGIFGPWQDFTAGEYIGRKFKFRGVFYSLDPDTTCILSRALFFVDMPDKIQSANAVAISALGTTVTYPVAFQVAPNVQITIVNAQDGDDVKLTNETATGFDITIRNGGVAVTRNINWLAKGY